VKEVEESITKFSTFKEVVELESFQKFTNTDFALKEITSLNEPELTPALVDFLESKLPTKRSKITLGVQDINLARLIHKQLDVKVSSDENVMELFRGVRLHFHEFLSDYTIEDVTQAQLGLGHSFSRNKITYDPNRQDKPIIQIIYLIESLDKDINLFCMRLKEWYAWHFPELGKIVNDNYMIIALIALFGTKDTLNEMAEEDYDGTFSKITMIIGDEDKAREVIEAPKNSMGVEFSELDLINITNFTRQIKSLIGLRTKLYDFMSERMNKIAPNMTCIIGE
jgi:nucleolar protein 56